MSASDDVAAGQKLFVYSTRLKQVSFEGSAMRTTISGTLGYIGARNEEEARGHAVARAFELKPGFSVEEVMVLEMPEEQVRAHLASASHSEQPRG